MNRMSLEPIVPGAHSVAVVHGGHERILLGHHIRRRFPWLAAAIVVASIVLVALVAADISTYEANTGSVQITGVNWYAGSILLITGAGFSLHPSEQVTLPLQCLSICFPFTGASVDAPFHLIVFSDTLPPIQNVNVTVQAPAAAFSGPLTITLSVDEDLLSTPGAIRG